MPASAAAVPPIIGDPRLEHSSQARLDPELSGSTTERREQADLDRIFGVRAERAPIVDVVTAQSTAAAISGSPSAQGTAAGVIQGVPVAGVPVELDGSAAIAVAIPIQQAEAIPEGLAQGVLMPIGFRGLPLPRRSSAPEPERVRRPTCCFAPAVDGIAQGRACGCCCPHRRALTWWSLVLFVLTAWHLQSFLALSTSAKEPNQYYLGGRLLSPLDYMARGLQEAHEAQAWCAQRNSTMCPLICHGCEDHFSPPESRRGPQLCNFSEITRDNYPGPVAYMGAQALALGVHLLGFCAGLLSTAGSCWLCARPVPRYPQRPGAAMYLLRCYKCLSWMPLLLAFYGLLFAFITDDDDEHAAAAWLLSLHESARPADAACSPAFLDRIRETLRDARALDTVVAMGNSFVTACFMRSIAVGVLRQLILAKSRSLLRGARRSAAARRPEVEL